MANRTKGPKKKGASKRRKKGAAPASTPLQPVEAEALIEDAPGQTLPFPVVCVGASAGGLEAFTQLLQALPLDTGMAFVLVSHLSPTHASHLADILSRATKLPVSEVRDEAAVGPDRVYVIPPDRSMIISQGVIKLRPRLEVRGVHHPIDEFLQSLAEDQGHKSIGVILSGTANDGTLGLEEIKAQGGITFAQDDTAQYDGMPRSAVLAGCVDFVLPPAAIARELARIARHPYVTRTDGPESSDALTRDERQHFVKILQLLNIRMGVDFTEYKANTLQRRVRRRMALHRIELLKDYAQYLHARPPELDSLYQDILITVTSFFRNPEAFEVLRDRIFPKLVAERNTKDPLRVWVLGCSTGEEAYSIAITFAEFMEESGGAIPIQIFATDVNGATIEKARAGTYPKTVAEHISPERLRRHFAEVDGHYRVAKPIREMCIFARHNGLSDPPFSRVDLISCRNLLIYLEPRTQNKLLPTLHFALKPHGVLWLGSSESIGVLRDRFEPEDAKQKFYSKKGTGLSHGPSFPSKDSYVPERPPGPNARSKSRRSSVPSDPQGEADRILLSRYPPPGVLVNSELEILQFRGDTGPFLAAPAGKASHGLIKMLREGLMVAVRSAINRARKEEAMIRKNGLRVKYDGRYRSVSIDVIPIKGRATRDDYFLVLFHESGSAGRSRSRREGRDRAADATTPREAYRLKQELTVTREYLQSVVEQQEAAYEELQSANEEVQSANEELQSINEELETSKEEIQSSNEELATVNDELNSRNTELAQSNSDLVNLLSSVQMAIVMVGPDLRIRRFTPLAERMVNLIASDIGRPLGDITLNIDLPNLVDLVKEVIDTVMPQQREVQDRDGRWFSLRVRPYKTIDNRIDGAVLVLVDVDAMKRTEDSLRTSEARYRIVHEQAPLGIFETDLQGRFLQVNDQFCAMTGRSREQLLELRSGDITAPDDLAVDLEAFRRIREGAVQSVRVQKRYLKSSGEAVWTEVHRFGISDADGTPRFTVGFVQDIGERLSGERTLRESQAALQDADLKKDHFIAMLAHELRNPLAPLRNISQLLHTPNLDAPTLTWVRGVLQRQLGNIERMVDDLLDVSRITQEKIRLQREKLALAVIVDRAVETLSDQLAATNKQLTVTLPPGTVMLDVDPVRMDQILGNLLYNSLKFTIPGGHIWVDAIVSAASPNEIEIRVRDDGQGIPPDLLPKVFDLFTQADVSLERTHGGLGIGLTLVKKLAELHGGTVEAHSDGPGTGAEFVVRMPVVSSARVKVGDSALPTSNGGVVDSFRILVVDDHIDTAMVTGALLRRAGHEVEMVHSGTEVEEATRRFKPEIILLDIGLPGMDGYAVARQLREEWKSAGPLLIAVSGYGGDEVHQRALSAGFNAYITKPYDLEGLNEVFATLR